MPRAFDSDEVERGTQTLRFLERVDCPACRHEFYAEFTDPSMSVEDIDTPPSATQTCPACRHEFIAELTGWTFYTEAG
jgi:hypothetical protein